MVHRQSVTRFFAKARLLLAILVAIGVTTPAAAQFSDSYKFLKAVRDADGAEAQKALKTPSSTLINTRDYGTGEAALHIVVKRRDMTWLSFLLGQGANPDIRDNTGNTPLTMAAQLGFTEGADLLLRGGAAINQGNNSGETALIIATQQRDIPMVRVLLANGADPRKADRIAGKSAHDYAAEDPRAAAVLKILDAAPPVKAKPQMSGPKL
jgi:ankyrin repeat protein